MKATGAACSFCGAARPLVDTDVLDEKWIRRYGGTPAVALDHGWYVSSAGTRVAAGHLGSARFFAPRVPACCDQCVTGWIEDLRWRAEPTLLSLAEKRGLPPASISDLPSLLRLAHLTAMLAELIPGMPIASSSEQRQAVRDGRSFPPMMRTWLFTLRQRLPARVHLSQATGADAAGGVGAGPLVQIVSIDVAHFCALVVIASDEQGEQLARQSALAAEFGPGPVARGELGEVVVPELDLASTPHPHQVAVHRLCAASGKVPLDHSR